MNGTATVRQRPARAAGFTLLELLIAIAVFAIMAALAYGGLSSVLRARETTAAAASRLRALQQTMLLLGRDLDQALPRSIRDQYGDVKPALYGGADWIEFTHGGWANPTGALRSELQRVAYTVRDKKLVRDNWQVLDRAPDSKPYEATLLGGVKSLALRYLDANGAWQESWPPQQQQSTTPQQLPLPRAVEVTLDLDHWGTVTRLFRLTGDGK